MNDARSLGYWSRETSHDSSDHRKDDGIYYDENHAVSASDEISRYRSLDNRHLLLTIAKVIIVLTILDVDLGIKRPATISLSIVDFIILVLTVEVGLGINRPATLPLKIMD